MRGYKEMRKRLNDLTAELQRYHGEVMDPAAADLLLLASVALDAVGRRYDLGESLDLKDLYYPVLQNIPKSVR